MPVTISASGEPLKARMQSARVSAPFARDFSQIKLLKQSPPPKKCPIAHYHRRQRRSPELAEGEREKERATSANGKAEPAGISQSWWQNRHGGAEWHRYWQPPHRRRRSVTSPHS